MIFNRDIRDPNLAVFLAEQLASLYTTADPSLIGFRVSEASGEGNTQGYVPATETVPAWHWVDSRSFQVVFIGGTSSLAMATNLVNEWSTASPPTNPPWLTPYFHTSSLSMHQLLQARFGGANKRLYICGHSLGGDLAIALGRQYRFFMNNPEMLIASYGSPRMCFSTFARTMETVPLVRWMNDNDPVPLLPPRGLSAYPFVRLINGEWNTSRWERWVHVRGGVSITPSGTMQPSELSPLGVVAGASSLAAWLFKASTDQSSVHSASEYVRRLQASIPLLAPPTTRHVVVAPIEPPGTTNRPSTNRTERQWQNTITELGREQQNAVYASPPEALFKAVKVGRLWMVQFGGELIAIGPNRKRASGMAVRGNELFRRLQRMAAVDVDTFSLLFQQALNLASTPGSGFSPPISGYPSL